MSFDISDYVDVAERERLLFERYPEARPQVELEEVRGPSGEIVAWKAKATIWRTPDDPIPVCDWAVEPVPGKTPYTRDSEAMNASTSAIGRAIVLAGFPSKHIASANEVRARQGSGAAVGAPNPPTAASVAPDNPAAAAQAAFEAANRAPNYDGTAESVEITFGKHKGRTLGALLQEDKGYIHWLAEKYDPRTPAQRLVANAARMLLGQAVGPLPGADSDPDSDIPF